MADLTGNMVAAGRRAVARFSPRARARLANETFIYRGHDGALVNAADYCILGLLCGFDFPGYTFNKVLTEIPEVVQTQLKLSPADLSDFGALVELNDGGYFEDNRNMRLFLAGIGRE